MAGKKCSGFSGYHWHQFANGTIGRTPNRAYVAIFPFGVYVNTCYLFALIISHSYDGLAVDLITLVNNVPRMVNYGQLWHLLSSVYFLCPLWNQLCIMSIDLQRRIRIIFL